MSDLSSSQAAGEAETLLRNVGVLPDLRIASTIESKRN